MCACRQTTSYLFPAKVGCPSLPLHVAYCGNVDDVCMHAACYGNRLLGWVKGQYYTIRVTAGEVMHSIGSDLSLWICCYLFTHCQINYMEWARRKSCSQLIAIGRAFWWALFSQWCHSSLNACLSWESSWAKQVYNGHGQLASPARHLLVCDNPSRWVDTEDTGDWQSPETLSPWYVHEKTLNCSLSYADLWIMFAYALMITMVLLICGQGMALDCIADCANPAVSTCCQAYGEGCSSNLDCLECCTAYFGW